MNRAAILFSLALAGLLAVSPQAMRADDPAPSANDPGASLIVNNSTHAWTVKCTDATRYSTVGYVYFYKADDEAKTVLTTIENTGTSALTINPGEKIKMVVCGSAKLDEIKPIGVIALHLTFSDSEDSDAYCQLHVIHAQFKNMIVDGKTFKTFSSKAPQAVSTLVTQIPTKYLPDEPISESEGKGENEKFTFDASNYQKAGAGALLTFKE